MAHVPTGADVPAQARLRTVVALVLVLATLGAVAAGGFGYAGSASFGAAAAFMVLSALVRKPMLTWSSLLGGLLLVILFIPIKRYVLPLDLPIQLEPYRAVLAILLVAWFLSLLGDVRVRLRPTGFEAPLLALCFAIALSLAFNPTRFHDLQTHVIKSLSFFASFLLLFYLLVSVLRSFRQVDYLVKILVLGGAIVAFFAIIEARTGFNPYDRLAYYAPFLQLTEETELGRGGRMRAFGPAQHPIALGAALTVLLPLAVYVARGARSRLWWLTVVLITFGGLATLSRTTMVMLAVVGIAFFWLRPRETRRLWPAAIAFVIATHFFLPGALGTMFEGFFPQGGLIAQQQHTAGSCDANARLNDVGPALEEVKQKPLTGYGYGTRITGAKEEGKNACVLDDEWLATGLEIGLLGVCCWAWLFLRFIRRAGRAAKHDYSEEGWLLASLAASVMSFAVGMFFFDAFSFIQVTLFMFILLAFGAVLLRLERQPAAAPAPSRPVRLAPARESAAG